MADLLAGFEADGVTETDLQQLEAELGGLGAVDDGLGGEALEEDLGGGGEGADDIVIPEEEVDIVAEEGIEMEDHLKEAVEGSLRLKRLLSEDDAGERKKLRSDDPEGVVEEKCKKILLKWQCQTDTIVKHVLEGARPEQLDELIKGTWRPDPYNMQKTPGELVARKIAEMRERTMPGGSMCDTISAFKFRAKLDFNGDKKVRALPHKELRYVVDNFDGTKKLDEVIEEAKSYEPEDERASINTVPEGPGVTCMGRFARLELIDPLADCAVFGDANLTFSLRLARHRKALGHVGRVIATTFEELDTLRERYKEIDQSIKILEEHFAEVYHGVDCTRFAIDPRFSGMEGTFGAVYYNFPHSGAIQGFFDGHPVVNWRHENLMRLFFRALRSFVKPGGIVKVSSNMGATGVRYSYIVGGALENEFRHTETVPFMEWHLHRYGRSYGDKRDIYKRPDAKNNQSYNAQAADRDMVYCFTYQPTGATLGRQEIRLPPTLKTLKGCVDGPFRSLAGASKDNLAKQLHKRFVTEISGEHVG